MNEGRSWMHGSRREIGAAVALLERRCMEIPWTRFENRRTDGERHGDALCSASPTLSPPMVRRRQPTIAALPQSSESAHKTRVVDKRSSQRPEQAEGQPAIARRRQRRLPVLDGLRAVSCTVHTKANDSSTCQVPRRIRAASSAPVANAPALQTTRHSAHKISAGIATTHLHSLTRLRAANRTSCTWS